MIYNFKQLLNWIDTAQLSELVLFGYVMLAVFIFTLATLSMIYDAIKGWMKEKVK